MRFAYENQGSCEVVIYHLSKNEAVDSMSLGMLTNNRIPGFAPASFYQKDEDKYIRFNVTGKVAAAEMFKGPVNKKRLVGLLQGIVDAMMAADDYMLDQSAIELNLEHIYMDPVTCETVVLCVPVFREDETPVDLALFLKNIVFNTQFDQTENTDHVAKIFNCLGAGSKLVLSDLKAQLDQIEGIRAAVPVQPVGQNQGQPPVQNLGQPVVQPSVRPSVQRSAQPAVPPNPMDDRNVPSQGFPFPHSVNFNNQEKLSVSPDLSANQTVTKRSGWAALGFGAKKEKNSKEPKKKDKPAKKEKGAKNTGPTKRNLYSSDNQVSAPNPGFAFPGDNQVTPLDPGFVIPGKESAAAQNRVAAALDLPPVDGVLQRSAHGPAAAVNFGATTVLGAEPVGTTVLGSDAVVSSPVIALIRKKTGERMEIKKQIFTIGSESYVDFQISGNSAISRSHAKIITRGNEYLLVDTNSTNGVYVRGQRIEKNVEVRIDQNSSIFLANEEFEFVVC